MDGFWAAPPVTRTYAALVVVESLLASLKLVSAYQLLYHHDFLFKFGPEIWRLVTSFCLTQGLSIVFLPYAIWTYGAPLERNSSRFNSASFLVYLLFVGSCIIFHLAEAIPGTEEYYPHTKRLFFIRKQKVCGVGMVGLPMRMAGMKMISFRWQRLPTFQALRLLSSILKGGGFLVLTLHQLLSGEVMGGVIFTNAMVLAITYTFAQENRGGQVQFFIMPVQVKFLPWVMLFFTLVNNGPEATFVEAMAIPAAHLYDFLTVHWPRYGGGRNLLPTPAVLERMFANVSGNTRVETKDHGTSFQPQSRSNATSGSSSGVSNPLSFRGTGRRLGN